MKHQLPWHRRYNWHRKDVIAAAAWIAASILVITAYYFAVKYQRFTINAELQTIAAEMKVASVDRRVAEAERDRDDAFAILGGYKYATTDDGQQAAVVKWVKRMDQ